MTDPTPQEEAWGAGSSAGSEFARDGGTRTTALVAASQQLAPDMFRVWLYGFGQGISNEAGTPAGWHVTTCGWCGGEAEHEDNCKNDT